MKANELRIGNLAVNFIGEVFEVNGNTIANFDSNEFGKPKPIPLTEEWLIKMGFEKSKSDNYLRLMIIIEDGTEWLTFLNPNVINFNDRGIFCLFVHELQNLFFALTGEELEINL